MTTSVSRALVFVAIVLTAGSCASSGSAQAPIVQPGAPGQPGRVLAPGEAATLPHPGYTDADVAFMQGMIHHHAQAVEMVELLKTRTESDDMRKLGMRIEVSQEDEIKMMRHWLESRGQQAPDPHMMHDMPGMKLMPGMLTPEQMQALAAAKGTAFDKLFLEGMIRHHAGAITMVHDLFAAPGAAQQSDIFAFASDVEADQKMEIIRMSNMLEEIQ